MRSIVKIVLAFTVAATAALLAPPPVSAAPTPGSTDGHATVEATWYSGTICVGCSLTQNWNHAPAGRIYAVGYSPVGATTSQPCVFQTTRTWYVQQPDGEREFWFTLKNIGQIACGADILLQDVANGVGAWPTGGINPGGTATKHWNNANPLTASYVVGMEPSGATSTTPCQFEVIRTWYQQQPGGEREFWFTIKNAGTITCQANILLAGIGSSVITNTGTLVPGATFTRHWNNAPLTNVYVSGLSPAGATATTACQMEVVSAAHQQIINPPAEREYHFTVKNVGSISCSADVLLAGFSA